MNTATKVVIATGAISATAAAIYVAARSRAPKDHRSDDPTRDIVVPVDLPPPAGEPVRAPAHPRARTRINRSEHDEDGTVLQSADELLEQAREFDPAVTLDELTGARLAASEHASGSFAEHACIVDSELNRAERKHKSLFHSLTHHDTFGKQGRLRRASTRRDPEIRHLLAARAVLTGRARGVSLGAVRFFDPVAMQRMNARYRAWVDAGRKGKRPAIVSCDALTLLEAWSFDYGKQGASRCPPDRDKRGRDTLAWVGLIQDVNPLRLMLMKPMPIGAEHTRHYQAACAVLRAGLDLEP